MVGLEGLIVLVLHIIPRYDTGIVRGQFYYPPNDPRRNGEGMELTPMFNGAEANSVEVFAVAQSLYVEHFLVFWKRKIFLS